MLRRGWQFLRRVVSSFRRNQGLLLAGAVAYNTLLSIVPLFAVLLAVLSRIVERQRLLDALTANLALVIGRQAPAVTAQVERFLDDSHVVGAVGALAILFFSSMAFTVLENAMQVIFFHRVALHRRHFLVSAVIPYVFMMCLGLGLLLVTAISGALDVLSDETIRALGHTWSLARLPGYALHLLGVVGLSLMLTALYLVMPVGRMAFRHALAGGVTATLLWEAVRQALVWYFAKLSMVNVLYGSFATTIIVLLTLEAASLILLFGAQVIAELERAKPPEERRAPSGEARQAADGVAL